MGDRPLARDAREAGEARYDDGRRGKLSAAAEVPLLVEAEGPVRILRLNRPRRLNAVSLPMYEALEAELARIGADFETRVVVVTGTGRGFCSGADLKAHRDHEASMAERHAYIETSQRVFRAIQTLPQPVVAAVNGHAIGAGCELALSCDFVIVAEEAKLRMPEVALGTFIGGGTAYTLRRRVGHARAAELILLGRYFTPEEAGAWGLANEVLPAEEVLPAALDLAGRLARNAPISMRLAKRLLDRAESVDPEEALRLEAEALFTCMASEDWREGLEAFAEKRAPVYRGR
ncbi:MAG: enoyl-CoA hydratase/isomerase family protein [Gemmatimonadales bacterium]|uniref:enoyl-CoA hydratase/isomerase family protein n=1 Tax=Candidatus Palauibacter irciniicola TaxID=3056733 RepID=UPI00137C7419|nr:enoyl-CoA hydratase/isomerase family protein [Candidatus Palauibacter irciniicola]MYC17332.1 enoyl-CoA hydratase/isomerase family protein [Gemmatimonadales bacterium]